MTPREQAIMDRHDSGMPQQRIVAELGFTERYVAQTIRAFDFYQLGCEQSVAERRIRSADARHAAAIAATGRRYDLAGAPRQTNPQLHAVAGDVELPCQVQR